MNDLLYYMKNPGTGKIFLPGKRIFRCTVSRSCRNMAIDWFIIASVRRYSYTHLFFSPLSGLTVDLRFAALRFAPCPPEEASDCSAGH